MKFEWDSKKATLNISKHGVTFREAATVFGDALAITYHDLEHSTTEDRFCTFGVSEYGKALVVVHTETEHSTRIISCRKMTQQERKLYEED